MAEVSVGNIAECQIALDHLHEIKADAPEQAMSDVIHRSQYVKDCEQERQRSLRRRNLDPPDAVRRGIRKLHGEDGEIVHPA